MRKVHLIIIISCMIILATFVVLIYEYHTTKLELAEANAKVQALENDLRAANTDSKFQEANYTQPIKKVYKTGAICMEFSDDVSDDEELIKDSEEESCDIFTNVSEFNDEHRRWTSLKTILQSVKTRFIGFIVDGDIVYMTFRLGTGKFVLFPVPPTGNDVLYLCSIPENIDDFLPVPLSEDLTYEGLDIYGVSYVSFCDNQYILVLTEANGEKCIAMLEKN